MSSMDIFIDPAFTKYYQQYPIVLVDVGARRGLCGYWKCAEKYLKVIGFEPDERSFGELTQSDSTKYLNVGLYKEKTVLDLYLTRKEGCTSILKPNRTFLDRFPNGENYDILRTIKINTDTLDNQLQAHQIKDVDFIKIDTQGSELFILEGATESLDNVFGLEVEVEFVQVYEDVPLFADVDSLIRKFGFQLFDLGQPYYTRSEFGMNCCQQKGHLRAADALYLSTPEKFCRTLEQIYDDVLKKSKALRALSICVLYGYFDYALEILNSADSLFDNDEVELITKTIKSVVTSFARKLPNFRGRARIANLFYRLWKVLQPNPKKSIIRVRLGTW